MVYATVNPAPHGEYPYPFSYTSFGSEYQHQFTYTDQLDNTKRLYSAKTTTDEVICVKFVRRYSRAAHEHCASKGFAPELKGFQYLPGGWYMVVMEMISQDYCCLDITLPYPHFKTLSEEIREELADLHQKGLVHGDIRDANVMVKVDDNTVGSNFKLVDFDWSGTIGEVKYPASVNRKTVWRPAGAKDGLEILADHDMQMLDYMIKFQMDL